MIFLLLIWDLVTVAAGKEGTSTRYLIPFVGSGAFSQLDVPRRPASGGDQVTILVWLFNHLSSLLYP